jgi:hypothetical protein
MRDRIKKDIFKVAYINNKRDETNNQIQIPERVLIFYGKTNPLTKRNWEITEDALNQRFTAFISIKSEELNGLLQSEELARELEKLENVSPEELESQNALIQNLFLFQKIFSYREIENIKKFNIEVLFSFECLYGDDTIETIKKKIISNIKLAKPISFDEVYLFSKQGIMYTPTQLYNKLSNNDTKLVTKKSLLDFLTNSHRDNLKQECEFILHIDTEELKDTYTYDDIIELFYKYKSSDIEKAIGGVGGIGGIGDVGGVGGVEAEAKDESGDSSDDEEELLLQELPMIEDIPIGQRFVYHREDIVFNVNPFNVSEIDPFIKEQGKNIISTTNKKILLDYEPIVCQTIFLCLAGDVLEYVDIEARKNADTTLISNDMIQVYYPYLAQKEIFTISDLQTHTQELLSSTSELLQDKNYKDMTDSVNLFYEAFYQRTTDLQYTTNGIFSLDFEIKPDNIINVPIDMLFKIIHANDEKPLIKLTKGRFEEKMYRLYANRIAENGKRIPYLKISVINKIIKEATIEKRLSVMIHCIYSIQNEEGEVIKDYIIPIRCEFDTRGSIFVSFQVEQPINDREAENIIKESVNPVINEVAIFLSQNGYTINLFEDLYHKNIVIREIKYKSVLNLPPKFKLDIAKNMGCISSIFNIINYNESRRVIMRYKRVSNYNELEGREAFIIELFLKSSYQEDVISGLMENFKISYEQALKDVTDLLDRMQLSELNKKMRIKINTHPGFLTTITFLQISTAGNLKIEVENIDNIYYLDHVEKMIDSLIRILQTKKSEPITNIQYEEVEKLCHTSLALGGIKSKKEIKEVKEFVVHGDKSVLTDVAVSGENDADEIIFDFENLQQAQEDNPINDIDFESLLLGNLSDESEGEEEEEEEPAVAEPEDAEVAQVAEAAVKEKTPSPASSAESGSPEFNIENIQGLSSSESEGEGEGSKGSSKGSQGSKSSDAGFNIDIIKGLSDDESGSGSEGEHTGGASDTESEEEEVELPEIEEIKPIGSDISSSSPEETATGATAAAAAPTPTPLKKIKTLGKISIGEKTPSQAPKSTLGALAIGKGKTKGKGLTPIRMPVSDPGSNSSSDSESESRSERGRVGQDITGASLSNPNPFFKRLEAYDPVLFRKRPGVKEYSRSCPWNVKRQPVILTNEEKEHIDKNHPGSYNRAMKYGSSKSKNFWYICPRYWDLRRNVSLTNEEVEKLKERDGDIIIPPGAKSVPPGKYIFEFKDKYHIDSSTGQYKNLSPGFIDSKESAGSEYCIPCCFSSENFIKDKQNLQRQACGCPSITAHNAQNPNSFNFECEGKEKAFLAGPVPRMRGKFGSLKPLSMQVSEPDFKKAKEEEQEEEPSRSEEEEEEEKEKEEEEAELEERQDAEAKLDQSISASSPFPGLKPRLTSVKKLTSLQRKEELEKATKQGEDFSVIGEEDMDQSAREESTSTNIEVVNENDTSDIESTATNEREKILEKEFVVMGPERNTELTDESYGYLLPQLQLFFTHSFKTCTINDRSTMLKPNVACLIQKGVQPGEIKNIKTYKSVNKKGYTIKKREFIYYNKNQSFIGSIADIYKKYLEHMSGSSLGIKPIKKISISKMKQIIVNAIDIDSFMTYQNGSLIDTFSLKKYQNPDADLDNEGIDDYDYDTKSDAESLMNEPGMGDATSRSNVSETFEQELVGGAGSDDEAGAGEEGEEGEGEELELTSFFNPAEAEVEAETESPEIQDITGIESAPSSVTSVKPVQPSPNPSTLPSPSPSPRASETSMRTKTQPLQEKNCIVDDTLFRSLIKSSKFKYKDSAIFKSIKDKSYNVDDPQYVFFKKLVCSYENFIRYIKSKRSYIDYEYLWEIISRPNSKLFVDGLNLVILQISNRDITNNIEVLCPTNHYTNTKTWFDDNKKTAILVKREVKNNIFFEPIYEILNVKPRIFNNLFTMKPIAGEPATTRLSQIPATIRKILTKIKTAYDSQCKPYDSIPREGTPNASKKFVKLYEFDRNLTLEELKPRLARGNFNILNQILNFDGKVIGVFIEEQQQEQEGGQQMSGTIMCEPSAVDPSIEQINYIDDESLWKTYDETIVFLNHVYDKIKIPCRPRFKVIDDGKLAGVITETDQFISIKITDEESVQTEGIFDIPILNTSDYNIADSEINTHLKVDPVREKYVKYIYLENNFYNVFRNVVRILINKYENNEVKESLLALIKQTDAEMPYTLKLTNLQAEIKRLISKYITFDSIHYTDAVLESISEITTSCLTSLNKNPDKCSETKYCVKETDDEGRCKMVIPKQNLLNPIHNNEVMYIARLADELIRYNRIRVFMFDRKIFPFMNVGYNLRQDEIILSQTMLISGYLNNLKPMIENKYANFNTYDTADPILTELYESIYDSHQEHRQICATEVKPLTTEYKKYFDPPLQNIKMLKFTPSAPLCTFEILLFILKTEAIRTGNKKLENITINRLKLIVLQFYIECIENSNNEVNMKNNIADIFKYYGMSDIGEEYKEKIKTGEDEDFIETIPFLESYWLTRLDIWIVANYYKLPIILLYYPSMTLIETQLSFSTLSTYFYDTSSVVELQEADAERRRDSSSDSEKEEEKEEEGLSGMGMGALGMSKKYMQEYYFIVVPRIKNEGVEIPTYSIISKDDKYLLPLSAIRPQIQDKIIEEMSKHYVSSSDILSGTGRVLNMDDLDNVFEREIKKDEFTGSKEYIVSFVRNFNLFAFLRERERTMSVFSTESQTPPPEFDVGQWLGESQGENPKLFPVEEPLFSQKKLPVAKSKKHVMPLSSIRMEKEKEITKKITPSKAEIAPKSTAAAATGPKTLSKKPRQKGVAVPKLNLNPIDEDTPPQPASTPALTPAPAPLLLPTFQAKSSSKKLKPISIGSSVAAAPATQPEPAAPLQQLGEEQGEEREE